MHDMHRPLSPHAADTKPWSNLLKITAASGHERDDARVDNIRQTRHACRFWQARTRALLQMSEGDDLRSQGRETMKAYSPTHTIEHTRLQVRESRAMADVGSDMRGSHRLGPCASDQTTVELP